VRVLAIVLVIGRHSPDYATASPRFRPLLRLWHEGGWIGVDIFFVLSGFLIGSILLEEIQSSGQIRIGRFYARRGFKIYPAFYAFLALYALLHAVAGDRPLSAGAWLSEGLFLQSYVPGVWGHTWSLAVEEHFYLVLPIVLIALRLRPGEARRNLMKVSLAGAVIAVVCLAVRITQWQRHPVFDLYTHMYPSHLRIDALFGGVVLACLWQNHREWFLSLYTSDAADD
jgi:peptidoglycan/LPS O-acetylase OafA/YrhL